MNVEDCDSMQSPSLPAVIFSVSQRSAALLRQDVRRAKQDFRTQVDLLEAGIKENLASNEGNMRLEQFFLDGIYIRKFYIPVNELIVSKVHALESFSIISKGLFTLGTEDGPRLVHPGTHFFAPAGTKRVLVTHADTIWSTIHLNPDNTQDQATLDARYTLPETRHLLQSEIDEITEEVT